MTLRIRPLRRAPTAFSVAARKPGNKTSTIISSSRCLRGGRKSISVRIMRFRVRYRRAAVSSPGNFDGDADFEILPRPVHGDSRRPEGVCERKASRSEEHTSELQSLMRISYAVFCLKKKKTQRQLINHKEIQRYIINKIKVTIEKK